MKAFDIIVGNVVPTNYSVEIAVKSTPTAGGGRKATVDTNIRGAPRIVHNQEVITCTSIYRIGTSITINNIITNASINIIIAGCAYNKFTTIIFRQSIEC